MAAVFRTHSAPRYSEDCLCAFSDVPNLKLDHRNQKKSTKKKRPRRLGAPRASEGTLRVGRGRSASPYPLDTLPQKKAPTDYPLTTEKANQRKAYGDCKSNLAHGTKDCKYEKPPFYRLIGWLKRERANCGLHPLIHTLLEFTPAQNMVFCQRGEKKPPLTRTGLFTHSRLIQSLPQWGLVAKFG